MRVLLFIFSSSIILTACAVNDRITRLYEDPDFSGGPFANVLVVGIHENANIRRRFESSLAQQIRSGGSAGAPSLDYLRSTDEISRESLVGIVERESFDAVLVTRLVDMQTRVETQEGRSTMEAQRRNSVPLADFFRYDYVEYQDPMEITTVRTVVLATDLYDVATEAKVWSAETTSFEKTEVYEIIGGTTSTLARALANDGFIR